MYSDYSQSKTPTEVAAAMDIGALISDGFGNGIWLNDSKINAKNCVNIAFTILQATRSRITKTEFIACPSCGRTLFNINETLQTIKEACGHLKGLKIGVMGCIVNGPGEMADADYGYVGNKNNMVTLYKGQRIIKRNVRELEAVDELIELIKQNEDWIEKTEYKNK